MAANTLVAGNDSASSDFGMAVPLAPSFLKKAYHSWATRSLAIGALATVIDLSIGLACLHLLGQSTRVGAMAGVAVGAAFTFFANRHFAFKEHNPKLAKPAFKFLVVTALAMVVHGQFVVLMRDYAGIPFVVSKVIADLAVFSVGQLFVLRYLVFPRAKPSDAGAVPDL
jgi:putative flippase GtrA